MNFILQPWQVLVVVMAAWFNRHQQAIIEFYQVELETMIKAQGKKRLLLTDDQRRVLGMKGKSLGRRALMELTTIVTPDTILRLHRTLSCPEVGLQQTTQFGRSATHKARN